MLVSEIPATEAECGILFDWVNGFSIVWYSGLWTNAVARQTRPWWVAVDLHRKSSNNHHDLEIDNPNADGGRSV
jgi:hypothetical protein